MIQKVNRPQHLGLVAQSKSAENDPGGSTGSGNFYESSKNPDSTKTDEDQLEEAVKKPHPHLSVVVSIEQSGMTEVVKDLLDLKNHDSTSGTRPGMSTRYSADSSTAKGLLLNKKAE